jgi:DNA-3-methyladenine glycosylase II
VSSDTWKEAERALAAADPDLARAIVRLGPCTLAPHGLPPFQALFRSIVYQQLSGKAADTILGRMLGLFDGVVPDPERLALAPADLLRTAGVSRAKAAALNDLGAHARDGRLPDLDELPGLTDEEIITRLTAVRGVGPWTAQMYLMFGLGRPDVLPDSDLGVQEGARRVYGGERPTAPMLREMGERWRPWRTVASWYMWREVDSAREIGAP